MEASRVRFGPLLEWLCAALLIVAGAAALTYAVHNARSVSVPMTPVMAHEAPVPDPPPGLRDGAVSVPILPLADGRTLRLGTRAADVGALMGAAQRGADIVDRDGTRDRITRRYYMSGTPVAIVLEAPRPGAEPLVVAIYR
jgi:hypothetical protein